MRPTEIFSDRLRLAVESGASASAIMVEPALRFGHEARDPMPAGKSSTREFLNADQHDNYFKAENRF
jgi:hypothetical protein